jgi:hypothetical protein
MLPESDFKKLKWSKKDSLFMTSLLSIKEIDGHLEWLTTIKKISRYLESIYFIEFYVDYSRWKDQSAFLLFKIKNTEINSWV